MTDSALLQQMLASSVTWNKARLKLTGAADSRRPRKCAR